MRQERPGNPPAARPFPSSLVFERIQPVTTGTSPTFPPEPAGARPPATAKSCVSSSSTIAASAPSSCASRSAADVASRLSNENVILVSIMSCEGTLGSRPRKKDIFGGVVHSNHDVIQFHCRERVESSVRLLLPLSVE